MYDFLVEIVVEVVIEDGVDIGHYQVADLLLLYYLLAVFQQLLALHAELLQSQQIP